VRHNIPDGKDDPFLTRGLVGVSWMSEDLPIDISCEAEPIIDIVPDVKAHPCAGIGAGFWL
jgi:hypothetical protein